ncbi:MAG: hypothetical protein CVV47_13610 [Spirochaetae bacterium HGW-Spirochaetae-3]|jgi:hypothetical protein|nr:MAG: hypothetical protein CVV47_13610 [Spirochaetae bacterium HGW-Spirochaetae-3]
MRLPAVTLSFDNPEDVAHWKSSSLNVYFHDANDSDSLFEINSFYYLIDYKAYLRHEAEIIERLQGKDKTTHPPIVVSEAIKPLCKHPCIHNANDMISEQASALFNEWLTHARVSHQYDHDAD